MWAEPTKGNNDYDVYLGPGEYYALIDYSEGVDVKVPISIRVPDETPVLTKTGPDRYEATCELLRNLYTMPIKLLPLLLNIKKYSKKDPGCYTQSLSLLGICINYPNGLFNFSSFQIWPLTEYFVIVFRSCSVPGMYSCIICSCRNVLKYSFAYTWCNI